MDGDARRAMHDHYELGLERDRLVAGVGELELERTKEIVLAHLPPPPATVADIGGGPGRYALWLAGLGYRVVHRDLVPLHVEQLADAAADAGIDATSLDSAVGDALALDLDDASVGAALLLGPLYHLPERSDRVRALAEARRVVRPGGVVVAAAISRWAARLHAVLGQRLHRDEPGALSLLIESERTGRLRPLSRGSFDGNTHRPHELAEEVADAGLDLVELVNVEGPAAMLPDIRDLLADPVDRGVVFDAARALADVPELLGSGPHLAAVCRRSSVS